MPKGINYIRLIGVQSKESTLIKSFLSIAREDGFNIEIDETEGHIPKLVIVDELFHSDTLVDDFPGSVVFIIGDDTQYHAPDYMARPLKWSSFQAALEGSIKKENADVLDIAAETESRRPILPSTEFTELYEVDGASEDANMYSRSLASQISNYPDETVSHSEYSSNSYSEVGTIVHEDRDIVQMPNSRIATQKALFEGGGIALGPNIVFWEDFDCLVTVKSRPVLYILSSTGNVYSEYDYLDWRLLLRSQYSRVYPLPKDWSANEKVSKYPLSWLVWASSISRSKGFLLKVINKNHYFMINEWPSFDVLYNNNKHLKLCSMLSTSPYSLEELISKTRFKSNVVVAFLNACEKQNLLISDEVKEDMLIKHKKLISVDILRKQNNK